MILPTVDLLLFPPSDFNVLVQFDTMLSSPLLPQIDKKSSSMLHSTSVPSFVFSSVSPSYTHSIPLSLIPPTARFISLYSPAFYCRVSVKHIWLYWGRLFTNGEVLRESLKKHTGLGAMPLPLSLSPTLFALSFLFIYSDLAFLPSRV